MESLYKEWRKGNMLSISPSIKVFSNESVLHIRWPKHWSISPSNEYSGLISFRMDWLDLLAVEGTLKSLLQHDNSKASILWHSVFFIVPTLTSIYDYWKIHSFDWMDIYWQSNVPAFISKHIWHTRDLSSLSLRFFFYCKEIIVVFL